MGDALEGFMITRSRFPEPIDLSGEVYPQEKQFRKKKEPKAINKIGKKGEDWNAARKELKKVFEAHKTTSCELSLKGCWKDKALTFAHVDKRRNLTPEELHEVVLACTPCHQQVEALPRLQMRKKLSGIIKGRGW